MLPKLMYERLRPRLLQQRSILTLHHGDVSIQRYDR